MRAACVLIAGFLLLPSPARAQALGFTASEREFLAKVARDSFTYFLRYADPKTGLVRDASRSGAPASIAATGFYLASLPVAKEHRWITHAEAYRRAHDALRFLNHHAQHRNGFLYHFLDARTGRRAWASEASSIDTALLVAGALVAGRAFPATAVERLAEELYDRVDWAWMLNGTLLLSHGWKPETGFLPYYWDTYSEHLILQALALGSATHPVPAAAWQEWDRLEAPYGEETIVYSHTGSLFTYQYAQAFIDFRGLSDRGIRYARNSTLATLANRDYCRDFQDRFRTYREGAWGLTACLGPGGYRAYGAKPGLGLHDGTVAPSAAAGSLAFTPRESVEVLRALYRRHGTHLYGPHGFRDSFNLDKNWWAGEYLGIDQGITVLMIGNALSEGIWNIFMHHPAIQRWITRSSLNPSDRYSQPKASQQLPSQVSPTATSSEPG